MPQILLFFNLSLFLHALTKYTLVVLDYKVHFLMFLRNYIEFPVMPLEA